MTPRRRQCRRQFRWTSCCLAIALASGVCAARAAGQTYNTPAPARASSQPAATPPLTTANPPAQDDYERLPFMAQTRNETGEEVPSSGGLLVRTAGALLLIVGLIVAAAWGLRRFGGAQFSGPSEDAPELSVLATISLGDRRALSAVRFGDRLLLLGSTAQAITLLASRERPPRNVTPRMRSVADLLRDDETQSFERALSLADERLKQRTDAPAGDKETV